MYMEDSDILIGSQEPEEDQISIQNRAKKSANIYTAGVHQIGGAIRPEKCRLYLISNKWVNANARLDYNP